MDRIATPFGDRPAPRRLGAVVVALACSLLALPAAAAVSDPTAAGDPIDQTLMPVPPRPSVGGAPRMPPPPALKPPQPLPIPSTPATALDNTPTPAPPKTPAGSAPLPMPQQAAIADLPPLPPPAALRNLPPPRPQPGGAAPRAAAPETIAAPSNSTPITGADEVRVLFAAGSTEVSSAATTDLTRVVARLQQLPNARLQMRAYASGTPETARDARRLSLTRALAVRAWLIGKGVRSTRMDVRALGATAPDAPADRVELVLIK